MDMVDADVKPGGPARGLFTPLTLRGVTLPHRAGVSPMCMYSAQAGLSTDYHLVHLGRFALGGAGLVMVEATAIDPRGRISHHDLGIWDDAHVPPLRRIAEFLESHGSIPGIQLGHAGRRAAVREPWYAGAPLGEDEAAIGLRPWQLDAPSALPAGADWPLPRELDQDGIRATVGKWADAARRAADAGFRVVELHGAHGYLLHSFQSPLANRRTDAYGGTADRRMRYPLEVVRAVRRALPDHIVLSYRVSAVDGIDGGLDVDDTVHFAVRLASEGVDLVDTSSGGITTDRMTDTRVRRRFAFHADFSRAVREGAGVPVATVGLIVDPEQAALLVERGDTDVVLLGREMLDDPNWAHHARRALGEDEFAHWDVRHGHALAGRAAALARLAEAGQTPLARFA
jgi:2,4-dienoyl-CoA reductase-like NADH-dependent reductase (Old Yellow Enzyme family)